MAFEPRVGSRQVAEAGIEVGLPLPQSCAAYPASTSLQACAGEGETDISEPRKQIVTTG